MAIWQFGIELIPRGPTVARFGTVPAELRDGDDGWLWSWQPPSDYLIFIESFARPYPSWSANIGMWGEESGDRVHVIHDGGRVVGIECRIDLRAFSADFTRGVLRLAQHCGCVFRTNQSLLIPAEWERLLNVVRASDELRFVTDPIAFFRELSVGDEME